MEAYKRRNEVVASTVPMSANVQSTSYMAGVSPGAFQALRYEIDVL